MQNECERSDSLIPSYLDGELSEEQAAPLRKHLLSCQPCRELAQDEQALKRWFVAAEAPAVPAGFAARVARRAFAGDTGVLPDGDVEFGAHGAVLVDREDRSLRLVLQLTAVAAAIMFLFALGIRNQSLPLTTDMDAEEPYPEVIESLEALNASEAAAEDATRAADREKVREDRRRRRETGE